MTQSTEHKERVNSGIPKTTTNHTHTILLPSNIPLPQYRYLVRGTFPQPLDDRACELIDFETATSFVQRVQNYFRLQRRQAPNFSARRFAIWVLIGTATASIEYRQVNSGSSMTVT
jgi:hypothetical protein